MARSLVRVLFCTASSKFRSYCTAENAVNLEYALLSLQNNYDLEGFYEKRQGALNALVACAPRQAVPCVFRNC